jgi:glyoxylase-like metal-dependent hydrolase (beta-lactamase superfamily II)
MPAMSAKASARICMYRLFELGDCFLVTFTAGTFSSRLLIDCGSFRNGGDSIARLKTITAKIKEALNGKPLDVVVGTHQHNDHLSGFVHCEPAFREMNVQQVWLSWLDDPSDPKALRIGEVHHNLKLQLAAVRDTLHPALQGKTAARPAAARALEVLDDMLGFYGAAAAGTPPEIPAKGVSILKSIGRRAPEYLRPGRTLEMPGLPPGSVRVHVLGPPRKENVERKDDPLYRKDPRTGESYDPALASAALQASKFLDAAKRGKVAASAEEENYPFNEISKRQGAKQPAALRAIMRRYKQRAEAWRRIDDDWMQQAGALALFLDTFTNNSSLVLAIEMMESSKVLLFAADAQTGNWASWKEVKWEDSEVSTDDLLARTVFYKVGHHASHNATLVEAFEKMSHPDLVALIPVHKKDPNITKKNGWKMPAKNLFKRLVEKTDHRVLQMDDKNPTDCNPNNDPAKGAWKRTGIKPRITDFSVEIDIAG